MSSLLLLIAGALGLAAVCRRSFAQSFPVVVLAASLITYGCLFIGHKSLALPVVLTALGVLAIFWVREGRHRREMPAADALLSPALAGLAAAVAIGWLCTGGLRFALLDDLVHWALYTKQLCFMQAFPNAAQIASAYGDYPPGVQMLLVFLQLGRPFSQRLLFLGQLVWCFALTLPLLSRVKWGGGVWKNLGKTLACALVLLTFPALFSRYYAISLVVEPVMGLLLGYALYTAWQSAQKPGLFELMGVSLALCVLALAKSTGLLYVVFGFLAIAILWSGALRGMNRDARLLLFFGVMAPFAAWYSWRCLCGAAGNASYFTEGAAKAYTLQNFQSFITGQGLAGQVTGAFFKALLLKPLNKYIGFSALGALALLWLAAWLLWRARRISRGTVGALTALTLCFAVYAFSVCYSYVYLFDESEALGLSAFSRYIAPLPTAMTYLLLGPLESVWGGLSARGRKACAGCALAVLALCAAGPLSAWLPAGYEKVATGVDGKQYRAAEAQVSALLPRLEKPGTDTSLLVVTTGLSTDRPNQLYRYFCLPAGVLFWSPQQCGSPERMRAVWEDAMQTGTEYVWCAPGSEATIGEAALADQSGRPLQANGLYRVLDPTGKVERVGD